MAAKAEKLTNAQIRMFLNSGYTCEELVRGFHLAQKRVAGVKRGLDNLSNAQIRGLLEDGCAWEEVASVFKLNRKRVEDISLKLDNHKKRIAGQAHQQRATVATDPCV